MATQTVDPPTGRVEEGLIDVRKSGRPPAPPRGFGGKKDESRNRPQWVSTVLALGAGVLALVGGYLLFVQEDETAVAPVTVATLYAAEDLPAGTTIDALLSSPDRLIEIKQVPEELLPTAGFQSVDVLEQYRGQRLLNPVLAGDPLTATRFATVADFEGQSFIDRQSGIDAPAGHMRVSVRLPPSRALGGSLAAGDTVSVLASFQAQVDQPNITALLLPAVEVVDVKGDRAKEPEDVDALDQGEQISTITLSQFDVTLAVTPQEATQLAYAMEYGKITLAVAVEGATIEDDRVADTLRSVLGLEDQLELDSLDDVDLAALEAEAEDSSAEESEAEDSVSRGSTLTDALAGSDDAGSDTTEESEEGSP